MISILKRIEEQKKTEVIEAKKRRPVNTLNQTQALPIRDFISPLREKNPAIIAEIKKASPSKGIIRYDFDVASIAKIYSSNGASCLSVLTDVQFFQGDPSYVLTAKENSHLPILRKDFIVDDYQVHESRALGADCILLIVAMLDDNQLRDYCQLAQALNMAVLVESHTLEELERALTLPTPLMGINNRSLHSFETNLQTSINLKQYISSDKIIISESGIHDVNDIQLLQDNEINAFLIGETLMKASDTGFLLKMLAKQHP